MEYDDCVRCGFKCTRVCTVSRATRKHGLDEFLERYLRNGEAVAWPCTGCHACEIVCPAGSKPYDLIQAAMRGFLKHHENALSDYRSEYTEHGRIGVSAVFLDNLVLPTRAAGRLPFLQSFDKIILFPGCLVSARYPGLVHRLYQLLVLLGAEIKNVVVEDESCCGSFLESIDEDEFTGAGAQLFKAITRKSSKTLMITACGSCTRTLQALQRRLITAGERKCVAGALRCAAGGPGTTTVMHYTELLAMPETVAMLKPFVEGAASRLAKGGDKKKHVYIQFPCQAAASLARRDLATKGLEVLVKAAGYETTRANHDLGCCGAGLLDTHPDLAIEYGVRRMTNITDDSEMEVGTIAVACGNCHRILVDFKPALEVECDCVEGMGVGVRFLLDMLMELVLP